MIQMRAGTALHLYEVKHGGPMYLLARYKMRFGSMIENDLAASLSRQEVGK